MENNKRPTIIAGPCAIETKKQFFETVKLIYKHVDIIRCGVWKARTSARSFNGKGHKCLSWLQMAQEKYQIPFAIEIGTPEHIKRAIDHNIT